MNHTQILNALIQKHNLKSYLEIGVQYPSNNFDKIKCGIKTGVDPCLITNLPKVNLIGEGPEYEAYTLIGKTSDEFFEKPMWIFGEKVFFDLIFIDGLHHADQVKRDFENSLKYLNYNGFIVIHDVLPENEQGTKVPRETRVWWGDVYKFAMTLSDYSDIKYTTYNIDNGCCVIQKTGMSQFCMSESNYTWEDYIKYKDFLLNVTDEVVI